MDAKAERVLEAVRRRKRPARDVDLAMHAQLSKGVVRIRLDRLIKEGVVEEYWLGERGPFYREAAPEEAS
jgi:predicted ArsR family transcriptional regulator